MYINKAMIYGNLTRDPEVRALPNGTQVASFSVATNRTYKDKNGAKQEQVDYHNVVTFARQAEVVAQYLRKGSSVYVEGRIQTRSWDDKDGTKKYRTEIMCESMQLGPRASGGAGGASSGGAPAHRNEEMHDDGPAASSAAPVTAGAQVPSLYRVFVQVGPGRQRKLDLLLGEGPMEAIEEEGFVFASRGTATIGADLRHAEIRYYGPAQQAIRSENKHGCQGCQRDENWLEIALARSQRRTGCCNKRRSCCLRPGNGRRSTLRAKLGGCT